MSELSSGNSVKKLEDFHVRQLKEQNAARASLGFSKIEKKVRRCLSCGCLFESIQKRMCGCQGLRPEGDHILGHYTAL